MAHNRLLSVYCSKEDCMAISMGKWKSLSGIHLDITAMNTKLSLRKVFSDQKKRYTLKKEDYIIAIDHPTTCVFSKDYEADNLLHFVSLHHFLEWLSENFG